MKKILILILSALLGFAVSGCQKMPTGEGVLEVTVSDAAASEYGYTVNIYPYVNGVKCEPIASEKVYERHPTATFHLNIGNYLINLKTAVQIREGETVKVTI